AASIPPPIPGAAVVPGGQPAPGRIEIAPPPGPLPGSVPDAPRVQIITPQVTEPPPAAAAVVIEAPLSPAPAVAAPAPNVVISPPNTGDGGLTAKDHSPLIALAVISALLVGSGLWVFDRCT